MQPIWAAQDKRRRRRRIELEAPCGTTSAYRRHQRRDEHVDDACRAAATAAAKAWRRRKRRGSIPDIIEDYLGTFDQMDRPELIMMIREQHPDIGYETIRRAIYRMEAAGRIQRMPSIGLARFCLVDE